MHKATKTLLFNAIYNGKLETVFAVLQDNPDAIESVGEHNNYVRDKTPLMFALQCANLGLANALLDRGANARAVMPAGPRDTVLQMCVYYAYCRDELEHDEWIGLATRLLDLGAEPTSALSCAVGGFGSRVKRADLIRLLLSRGANPDAQAGNSGNTVREIVEINKRLFSKEVLDLFHVQPAADHELKVAEKPAVPPFMSHPSGEFEMPVDAMADAIKRLRALPKWAKWITFCAQGMGPRVDTYHFASIRMRQGEIAFMVQTNTLTWIEKKLEVDIQAVTSAAGVPELCLSKSEAGYFVGKATPIQAARIMDVIFRQYMGIRPHTGEGDGYAIGAEWQRSITSLNLDRGRIPASRGMESLQRPRQVSLCVHAGLNVRSPQLTIRVPYDFALMNTAAKPIRVVLAKVGLDGHDRGIKIVARGLRDGGCHVIYGGLWQSPEAVVRTVADEDAHWLGLSLLSGAHLTLVPRVMRALAEGQLQHVGVVIGGIIPAEDIPALLELGVARVFGPGTTLPEIVAFVHSARVPRTELPPPLDSALKVPATIQERLALSRLISLASDGEQEAALRQAIAARNGDLPRNRSPIIALTGSAGVGKSTLIGKLLATLRSRQRSAAVLACDPKSSLTGGALLGDRVRMAAAAEDGVFIRSLPVPAGRQALADNLPLILELTTAAGFDCVLLETAGAGQGDTAVRDLANLVVVLVQPEAGDELQWEKAGLLEIADVVVVHKADLAGANRVTSQLRDLLNLPGSREIPVVAVSSSRGHGVETLWDAIKAALASRGATNT